MASIWRWRTSCFVVLAVITTSCFLVGMALPASVAAQAVMLRIRPHVGDTLRMKMEQRIEITGDTTDPQTLKDVPMSAVMCVYTRAIVEGEARGGTTTTMLSITDSVTVTPAIAATLPLFAQTKRALEGKTVRLHVAQDGAISVDGGAGGRTAQRLPAVLPDKPVAPGDEWTRDLAVPVSATHGSTGTVRATFRLDSLGPDGVIAYVSMHGTFSHKPPALAGGAAHDETTGTIDGTMQIDRRLEWLTDSRTTVTLLSMVQQPPAVPTRVHMKIMQSMRAMPRR